MLDVTALGVVGIHSKWIDMVIRDEHLRREAKLTQVMGAMSLPGSLFCRNNTGKNKCRQNGNHRDDNQ